MFPLIYECDHSGAILSIRFWGPRADARRRTLADEGTQGGGANMAQSSLDDDASEGTEGRWSAFLDN